MTLLFYSATKDLHERFKNFHVNTVHKDTSSCFATSLKEAQAQSILGEKETTTKKKHEFLFLDRRLKTKGSKKSKGACG